MKRPSRGFTLIELIVVVAIIVLLASLLTVWLVNMMHVAKYKQARALVEHLDTACDHFREDYGQYPPTTYAGSKNLHVYLGAPAKTGGTPYFTFTLGHLDPSATTTAATPPSFVFDKWGRPLDYANRGAANAGRVDIRSLGRDGVVSTDDVLNGQRD